MRLVGTIAFFVLASMVAQSFCAAALSASSYAELENEDNSNYTIMKAGVYDTLARGGRSGTGHVSHVLQTGTQSFSDREHPSSNFDAIEIAAPEAPDEITPLGMGLGSYNPATLGAPGYPEPPITNAVDVVVSDLEENWGTDFGPSTRGDSLEISGRLRGFSEAGWPGETVKLYWGKSSASGIWTDHNDFNNVTHGSFWHSDQVTGANGAFTFTVTTTTSTDPTAYKLYVYFPGSTKPAGTVGYGSLSLLASMKLNMQFTGAFFPGDTLTVRSWYTFDNTSTVNFPSGSTTNMGFTVEFNSIVDDEGTKTVPANENVFEFTVNLPDDPSVDVDVTLVYDMSQFGYSSYHVADPAQNSAGTYVNTKVTSQTYTKSGNYGVYWMDGGQPITNTSVTHFRGESRSVYVNGSISGGDPTGEDVTVTFTQGAWSTNEVRTLDADNESTFSFQIPVTLADIRTKITVTSSATWTGPITPTKLTPDLEVVMKANITSITLARETDHPNMYHTSEGMDIEFTIKDELGNIMPVAPGTIVRNNTADAQVTSNAGGTTTYTTLSAMSSLDNTWRNFTVFLRADEPSPQHANFKYLLPSPLNASFIANAYKDVAINLEDIEGTVNPVAKDYFNITYSDLVDPGNGNGIYNGSFTEHLGRIPTGVSMLLKHGTTTIGSDMANASTSVNSLTWTPWDLVNSRVNRSIFDIRHPVATQTFTYSLTTFNNGPLGSVSLQFFIHGQDETAPEFDLNYWREELGGAATIPHFDIDVAIAARDGTTTTTGVRHVLLMWQLTPYQETVAVEQAPLVMTPQEDLGAGWFNYTATIPEQIVNTTVEYWFRVEDYAGYGYEHATDDRFVVAQFPTPSYNNSALLFGSSPKSYVTGDYRGPDFKANDAVMNSDLPIADGIMNGEGNLNITVQVDDSLVNTGISHVDIIYAISQEGAGGSWAPPSASNTTAAMTQKGTSNYYFHWINGLVYGDNLWYEIRAYDSSVDENMTPLPGGTQTLLVRDLDPPLINSRSLAWENSPIKQDPNTEEDLPYQNCNPYVNQSIEFSLNASDEGSGVDYITLNYTFTDYNGTILFDNISLNVPELFVGTDVYQVDILDGFSVNGSLELTFFAFDNEGNSAKLEQSLTIRELPERRDEEIPTLTDPPSDTDGDGATDEDLVVQMIAIGTLVLVGIIGVSIYGRYGKAAIEQRRVMTRVRDTLNSLMQEMRLLGEQGNYREAVTKAFSALEMISTEFHQVPRRANQTPREFAEQLHRLSGLEQELLYSVTATWEKARYGIDDVSERDFERVINGLANIKRRIARQERN